MMEEDDIEDYVEGLELILKRRRDLDDLLLEKLAVFKSKLKFKKEDYIIREGDEGKEFYFVVEGTANAMKNFDGVPTIVKYYSSGDYFGELALISDGRRAASIIVTSEEITVVSLDKATFT